MLRVNTDSPARLTSTLLCALALTLAGTRAQAQRTAADSLAERLRRAEAAIAALQTQVAEQASGGVSTRSGARLQLHGRMMIKAFGNARRVNNVDNPQFVLTTTAGAGNLDRSVGMAARESRVGLVVTAPEVLGGAFTGDVDVDFYGGQFASSGGRTFPLVRLRTARAVIRWSETQLLVGQESPLISGLNPATLGAVGTPTFAAAGNLWLWLPQFRLSLDKGTSTLRWGVQMAALAPTSGDPVGTFETDFDIAERSQRPYVQGRMFVRQGEGDLAREVGCGVHRGWFRLEPDSLRVSRALACDVMLPITDRLELRGEYFAGQGLRGLGGGGIGQSFTAAGDIVRTTGGWAQFNAIPMTLLRVGVGCGTDQPETAGVARQRNDACSAHAIVRPSGPVFFGIEARRLRTRYASGPFTSDHVTAAFGFEF